MHCPRYAAVTAACPAACPRMLGIPGAMTEILVVFKSYTMVSIAALRGADTMMRVLTLTLELTPACFVCVCVPSRAVVIRCEHAGGTRGARMFVLCGAVQRSSRARDPWL